MLFILLLLTISGCQAETEAEQMKQQPVTIQPAAPGVQKSGSPRAVVPTPRTQPAPVATTTASAASRRPGSNESGTALKADDIRAEPFGDAATVGKLQRDDRVEILKKDGGWLQINSSKGNGWVRMLSIRKGDAAKVASADGLLGMASGRAGTGKVVATTGIRGLNEEELKTARFNEAEVTLVESYTSSKADAADFAARGKLVARPFAYLAATR